MSFVKPVSVQFPALLPLLILSKPTYMQRMGVTGPAQGVDYEGRARKDFSTDFKQPESPPD